MTLQTMSFIFGAILLAVAILGGGFEIKEIKVPNVTMGGRIIAGIVGIFFVGLGFWETERPPPDRTPPPVVRMSEREHDKDRLGGDYRGFDIREQITLRIARTLARPMRNALLGLTSNREFKDSRPGATSRALFPRRRTMHAAYPAQKFDNPAQLREQTCSNPDSASPLRLFETRRNEQQRQIHIARLQSIDDDVPMAHD
jgi:hypothetical protein